MMTSTKAGWRWRIAGVLFVMLLAVLWAANAGKFLLVNDPQPSDLILVLAGETEVRPARAIELLDRGYARRVVIDVPAQAKDFGFTEIELAQQYVRHLKEAASVGICPIYGLSTRGEARDAEKCLAGEPGNRILIVTSDFHTRRALATFRRVIRKKTFSVAAAFDDTQFGTHWWQHRQWAKTFLDEWLRLLWWMAVDRWR
jgi:uncharacterized SAM-binding protein YcdF (DUF218 family)